MDKATLGRLLEAFASLAAERRRKVRTFRCKACGREADANDVAELLPHADGRNVPFASTRACFHKHFQDVTDATPEPTTVDSGGAGPDHPAPSEESWRARPPMI